MIVGSGRIGRRLGAGVVWVADRAGLVAAIGLGLAIPLLWFGATHLPIDSDTSNLISDRLPWRRTYIAFVEAFPQFRDEIHVVVDAVSPELADSTVRALHGALARRTDLFADVYAPGVSPFFQRNGLLYRDIEDLEELAAELGRNAPLWRILEREPTLAGLAAVLERIAATDSVGWEAAPFLDALSGAFYTSRTGHYLSISWSEAMGGRGSGAGERRRFLLVQPKLQYSLSRPAGPAIEAIRAAADRLEMDRRAVRVRITGSEAVEHESIDSGLSEVPRLVTLALVFVALILLWALRSPWLVAASLTVLLAGLAATTAFAAVAVGHLNMISVAFAVLYVGLGIDYAIHFCLGYQEAARETSSHRAALRRTAERTGVALFLSAVTTALCFYAFMATDFTGVADLGKIGGTGMLISFAVTMVLLPALLTLRFGRGAGAAGELRSPAGGSPAPVPPTTGAPGGDGSRTRRPPLARLDSLVARRPRPVILGAVSVALACGLLLPRVRFDQDVQNLSDPSSESVITYRELLEDPNTASLTVSVLVPDSGAAAAVATRLRRLEEVEDVITLDSFVPSEQEAKLAILRRMATDLGPAPAPDASPTTASLEGEALPAEGERAEPGGPERAARLTAVARVEAIARELALDGDSVTGAAAQRLLFLIRAWRRSYRRWSSDTQESLAQGLEASMVGTLPFAQKRLRAALSAGSVERGDLPRALVERWSTADGRERLQVLPTERLDTPERIREFVEAVRAEEPRATGAPVNDVESGRVAVRAFLEAFGLALLATAVALLLLLGDPGASALVLSALLLAGMLTGALSVVADIPFSIANIITLPLLLGIGVDAGIHMVHRRRLLSGGEWRLLDTATGRAILYSGLTTIAGFGNLALARHRAMAGMGGLLTIGMVSVLACTLVVLPALMSRRPLTRPQTGGSGRQGRWEAG